MPDHSPKIKANAMTTYGCPEVKPEDSAAYEAGDLHAIDRDEITSGSESVDACMASSPLPPLPPSPIWQSSSNIYNTKSTSWSLGVEMGGGGEWCMRNITIRHQKIKIRLFWELMRK